jgi:hypothetical protein
MKREQVNIRMSNLLKSEIDSIVTMLGENMDFSKFMRIAATKEIKRIKRIKRNEARKKETYE